MLRTVIGEWRDGPILMCGMIGSRQGWKEAPYAACPLGLSELGRSLVPVKSLLGDVRIVGGAMTRHGGHHDIMRGEETQILGLADTKGRRVVVTPGTHSKWAELEDGIIRDFRTYMTGELFAVLKKHSTLGWMMQTSEDDATDHAAFQEGARDATIESDMLHSLFNTRTLVLFDPEKAENISSYLSGLLIGYEILGAARHFAKAPFTVIGTKRLARLYEAALLANGYGDFALADADTTTALGLWRIWRAAGSAA